MATNWQRFRVEIPEGYTPAEREAIGEEILDYIRERTQKGLNKLNKEMPGYSDEYARSLEFKIAGKSKNRVDLTLSGDMLGAMTVLSHKNGSLLLGFEKGTEENAKADGNIRGTYGNSKPIGKKRDFLGISKSDLERIIAEHPIDDRRANVQAASAKGAKKAAAEVVVEEDNE